MQAKTIPVAAKTIAASAMMAHMHFAFVRNSLLRLLFYHCALLIDRLSRFHPCCDMVRTRLCTLAKNTLGSIVVSNSER